jgi:hypothetical protein
MQVKSDTVTQDKILEEQSQIRRSLVVDRLNYTLKDKAFPFNN